MRISSKHDPEVTSRASKILLSSAVAAGLAAILLSVAIVSQAASTDYGLHKSVKGSTTGIAAAFSRSTTALGRKWK